MKKGFTVVEVSLVLAVAGLIFAMAFVALPALQRSSRDTARNDDMADFIANVKKYQTNNRGALPGSGDSSSLTVIEVDKYYNPGANDTTWQGFYNKYLGENFYDPSGEVYSLKVEACDVTTPQVSCGKDVDTQALGKLLVLTQATCNGTDAVRSSNPRNLAVLYRLEGSGRVGCNST